MFGNGAKPSKDRVEIHACYVAEVGTIVLHFAVSQNVMKGRPITAAREVDSVWF